MGIGFELQRYDENDYNYYEIGAPSFLYSFFSTVCLRLEDGEWGSKYPIIMNELYQGELDKKYIDDAIKELKEIKKELARIPSSEVVWDMDNLDFPPPWGYDKPEEVIKLSDYYVTSDGKDFLEVFEEVLEKAKNINGNIIIT